MNIELFPCSGGIAEGARRAGVRFDLVIDKDPNAVESYHRNHGHRPVQMDVNDFLEMVRGGWRPSDAVDLITADPPCVPWSRAGKRLGLEDDRDCLKATADLIRLLRPRRYLIGNVPGLQDSTSWGVVQDVIGGLAADGYCVRDYACFDCAEYGIPQRRIRPFWFGHFSGPCIQWPAPTHAPPTAQVSFDGHALLPWVTCRQALQHVPPEEMGRSVRMTIRPRGQDGRKNGGDETRCSTSDQPAATVVSKDTRKGGAILLPGMPPAGTGRKAQQAALIANEKHPMSDADQPAMTVTPHLGATGAAQGGGAVVGWDRHPASTMDAPAMAVRANGDRAGSNGGATLLVRTTTDRGDTAVADEPARTITTNDMGEGATLEWPWDRPSTTVAATDDRLPAPGHHASGSGHGTQHGPNAIILSERCAAILQGFPDGPCAGHDEDGKPAPHAGLAVADGVRPGTACPTCGEVRRWHFYGKTKQDRWSMLGQAMPPGMSEAIMRAVVEQARATGEGKP